MGYIGWVFIILTQLMTVVSLVLIDPPEESGLRYRPRTQTSMPVLPGKLTCTLWDRVRTKGQIEGEICRIELYFVLQETPAVDCPLLRDRLS